MITLKQENGLARSYEYCREGIPSSQDGKTAKLNWLVLKKVSRGMEPLVIDETQKDPLLVESRPTLEEFNIQSLIAYPLVYKSSFIGLVMLHRCGKPVRWNDQEITLFSTVVEHMAVAISNAQQLSAIQTLAVTDTLTGLYNRRFFEERLSAELRNAQQQRYPMCLALLDIDYFKKINDTFGHAAGDRALHKLGLLLKTNLRKGTVVARFGGEEFAVILPNMSLQTADLIMEKIRNLWKAPWPQTLKYHHDQRGVTETRSQDQRELAAVQEELIRKADKNLYHAKRSGRNQVCVDLVQTAEVGRS
jgi:diguanylate cyclase (GGDEF)-like protein